MNETLLDRIRPVTRRLRSVRFWRLLSVITFCGAGCAWLIQREVREGELNSVQWGQWLLAAVAAIALLAYLVCRLSFRNPRAVARQIEQHFPSLDQRLLTALSQREEKLSFLQQRVVREAREHSRTHRWAETVPTRHVVSSRLSGLSASLLFVVFVLGLMFPGRVMEQVNAAANSVENENRIEVQPGDAQIERGTSLVVTARFGDWVPERAEVVCESEDGTQRRVEMARNLDDPVLGGFVSSVDQSFTYRVVTPAWESEAYDVEVFEFPELVRSDALLNYPDYSGLDSKLIEDTVRVSAVEGTELTWICFLNKAGITAELVDAEGTRTPMKESDEYPGAVTAVFVLSKSSRMKLELVDEVGRKNKYPPELVARVLPNRPPSLKLTQGGDLTVSPLEEVELGADIRDDFGMSRLGLSYTFHRDPPKEVVLAEATSRGEKVSVAHLLAFEELEAEPDQLLSYHFWAEDVGPDGEPRRTESDMFFAEVRPFDEIFREGEQPPGGQQQQQQQQQQQGSQNGQQAEQLAELQKQIISAT